MDKDMKLWLKITPMEVRLGNLMMNNDIISLSTGFKSYVQMVSGEKPAYQSNSDLPRLIVDNTLNNNLQIGLQGLVTYEQATDITKKAIADQVFTFENGKRNVKVNDLKISPSGEKLLVKLDLTTANQRGKKTGGIVYIEGTPWYDAQTQTIRVKDFDYNLKSKNLLLKSAAWLVNKTFLGQIEEKLVFPLKDYIADAQKQAQQSLTTGTRVGDMALLKGTLNGISPQGIYVTPKGIVALLNINGKINILIDKL
jgi:hypothetical protein